MKIRTYNSNGILAIIAISGFLIGSEVTSFNSFLSTIKFNQYYGILLKREQALLAASTSVGAVFCGSFCDFKGCIPSFQVANLLWIFGSVTVILLRYVYVLFLGRLLKGASIGFITCTVPIYISEVFPLKRKGSSISAFHLCSTLGTIAMYFVGYLLEKFLVSYYPFKAAWILELIPSLVSLLLTFLLPESPKWLASKSRWTEAAKTLERVRTIKKKGMHIDDRKFVTKAYTSGSIITYCTYSNLFGRSYWKSTSTGLLLHLFSLLTSVTSLMYFFTYICDMCGLEGEFRVFAVSIQYVLLGLLTVIPLMVLDKARRVDFLSYGMVVIGIGFFAMYLILALFSTNLYVLENDSPFDWSLDEEPASALVAVFLFIVSVYTSSITSVSWLYTSEIFDDESRAKGTSICMGLSWVVNAVTTLILPLLFRVANYYVFLGLGIISVICGGITLTFQETKVRSQDSEEVYVMSSYFSLLAPSKLSSKSSKGTLKIPSTESKSASEKVISEPSETTASPPETEHNTPSDRYSGFELDKVPSNIDPFESSEESGAILDNMINAYTQEEENSPMEIAIATASQAYSPSQNSYFSNDWNQSTPEHNEPTELSPDIIINNSSNNSDNESIIIDNRGKLISRKEVQASSYLQFDGLRVALRNYVQGKKPIKKSKNLLRSV